MPRFTVQPQCPNCESDLGWPVGYNEREGIEYRCTTCGPMDGYHTVHVEETPTEFLRQYLWYAKRVNASIRREEDGEPRYPEFVEAIRDELEEHADVPDIGEFDHKVTLSKKQAMDLDHEYPGISTVGEPPEDAEYEFGMSPSEIEFQTLMTEAEANEISEEFDDVTVEQL